MARSTTTIANERSNFDLIDPLLKLEEERNPRTAFGGTIGGRTFYELMRDPTVSFTEDITQFNTDTSALYGFSMSLVEIF